MQEHLKTIRRAYDLTVRRHKQGVDPLGGVPEAFTNSPEFRAFMAGAHISCSSGAPENKAYLDPQPGMRFLDAGCCSSLANYRLDAWPGTYYGVDISPALIEAMQRFARDHHIAIGGLCVAELAALPFGEGFFDIAEVIGVLEYCTFGYTERALAELNRVLKPGARAVVDVPNLAHLHVEIMFRLEGYLGRPEIPTRRSDWDRALRPLFNTEQVDDTRVMLKYFLRARK